MRRWVAVGACLGAAAGLEYPAKVTKIGKVFCLGQGHTGTTSLKQILDEIGLHACHHACVNNGTGPKYGWDRESRVHRKDYAEIFATHSAFLDGGPNADWAWLDAVLPQARFVLNTRALLGWSVAVVDNNMRHYAYKLEACGLATFLAYTIKLAATHEAAVLAYFSSSAERRSRFAVVDVVKGPAHHVERALHWVTREDLAKFKPRGALIIPENFQAVSEAKGNATTAHSNAHAHSAMLVSDINATLALFGCAEDWGGHFYARCAARIPKVYFAKTRPGSKAPKCAVALCDSFVDLRHRYNVTDVC
ncbi:hypothetical protein M885DRAFT_518738 [Pelagophyceae sp. CCMP2097]|nr:hypothetical protein M885DRAFT_518738 [Pelagophyceae sp. CCMP2097]|mmetsp:Transcript_23946/g.85490  ORF Transcript_23946/g.85490 Transcript_23946/m.85490 type:complete len:306 (+) Transcript_23946:61-978(+)